MSPPHSLTGLFSFSLVTVLFRIDTQSGNQDLKYPFSVASVFADTIDYMAPAHTHPHNANEKRTYEKIKFMIKGVGFLFSAVFFFVDGGQSTNRNSNFNVESSPDSTQHSRICLERFEYKCEFVKTFRV